MRTSCLSLVILLGLAASAFAQDWAKKMFSETEHDFKTVARGAKVDCGVVPFPTHVGMNRQKSKNHRHYCPFPTHVGMNRRLYWHKGSARSFPTHVGMNRRCMVA